MGYYTYALDNERKLNTSNNEPNNNLDIAVTYIAMFDMFNRFIAMDDLYGNSTYKLFAKNQYRTKKFYLPLKMIFVKPVF